VLTNAGPQVVSDIHLHDELVALEATDRSFIELSADGI
jgi:hypothetical protein